MKTTVQNIFDSIELARKNGLTDTFIINNLLEFKDKTLEKEKQMILKFAQDNCIDFYHKDIAEETFNETFKND